MGDRKVEEIDDRLTVRYVSLGEGRYAVYDNDSNDYIGLLFRVDVGRRNLRWRLLNEDKTYKTRRLAVQAMTE